jgi:hypothetical protein
LTYAPRSRVHLRQRGRDPEKKWQPVQRRNR